MVNRTAAVAVLAAVVGYMTFNWSERHAPRPEAAPKQTLAAQATESPPPNPVEKLKISKMDWRLGGFGTVAIVTLTFDNQNDFRVKDPLIACSFYGRSGTLIDTKQQTLYEAFSPKKKRTIKDIRLGFVDSQVARSSCRILYATGV